MKDPCYELDRGSFSVGYGMVLLFIVIYVISPDIFDGIMNSVQKAVIDNTGWLTVFLSVVIVVFTICISISPLGSIRIGGAHARPDFSLWRWFCISLCAGIGIGILFWGIGEPIYHFMQPPTENLGIEPCTHRAAVFAVSQSIVHWTVAQYSMYAICGVTFALMCFSKGAPLSIMDCFSVLFKGESYSAARVVIHAICLFSLSFAVISSMGSLIMMVASLLSHLTGLPRSFGLNAVICAASVGLFVVSALSGLKKRMTFLSRQTTRLFIFLMFFIFILGPTVYILSMGTEVFGYTLTHFFHNSSLMSTEFMHDTWAKSWLAVYMAFFFGYAPPIGLFLARLGKGRTVRQFLLMNIFAPTIFVYFWINTFGSLAIYFQWTGIFDVWTHVQANGLESTVAAVISRFPLSGVLAVIFIICTMTSFATLADPMTTVLATLSTRRLSINDEAPRRLKALWGVTTGVTALLLISTSGLAGLRGMAVFSGVVMMFVTVGICVCFMKIGLDLLDRRRHRLAVQQASMAAELIQPMQYLTPEPGRENVAEHRKHGGARKSSGVRS